MGLLVATLMQAHNEMEKVEQGNIQCTVRKGTPASVMELNPVLQEIKSLKNGIDAISNNRSGDLRVNPIQLSFQFIKRN